MPFCLADIGEGINEVVIKEWFVKVGGQVQQFDSLCEVQSDKASVTITSRYDGTIEKIYYQVDDVAKVGQPLVDIKIKDSESDDQVDQVHDLDASSMHHDLNQPDYGVSFKSTKLLAIPSVRRIAQENYINLADVKGTGKDGRILKEDILAHIDALKQAQKIKEMPIIEQKLSSQPSVSQPYEPIMLDGKDQAVKLKGIQKAMFKTMKASLSVPHFGYCDELDLTNLVELIKKSQGKAKELKIKLTFMPFLIKTLSLALKDYPVLNGSVDEEKEMIIYKSSHNIGFAMDTKEGLIVPNIKNVQNLTILEIALELNRLQELGSKNQITSSDLTNGTITVSNIGSVS